MKRQKKTLIIKLMSLLVLGIVPASLASCFDNSKQNNSANINNPKSNDNPNNKRSQSEKYLYSNYQPELEKLSNSQIKENIIAIGDKFQNEINPLLDENGKLINIYEMIDNQFKDNKQNNSFYYLLYANAYLNSADYERSYYFSLIQIWNNDKLKFTDDKDKYDYEISLDISYINSYLNPNLRSQNQNYFNLLDYQIKYLNITDDNSIQNLQDSKRIAQIKKDLNFIKNFIEDFLNFVNR